jgi:hypothetical protein
LHVPLTAPAQPSAWPLQASQAFPHAVLQQNPSTQNPVPHTRQPADLQSAPATVLQLAACAFCAAQAPAALQYEPAAQSASLPHDVGQIGLEPLHTYGEHDGLAPVEP